MFNLLYLMIYIVITFGNLQNNIQVLIRNNHARNWKRHFKQRKGFLQCSLAKVLQIYTKLCKILLKNTILLPFFVTMYVHTLDTHIRTKETMEYFSIQLFRYSSSCLTWSCVSFWTTLVPSSSQPEASNGSVSFRLTDFNCSNLNVSHNKILRSL